MSALTSHVLASQPTPVRTQLNKQVWLGLGVTIHTHSHTHLKSRTVSLCLVFSGAFTKLWDSKNSMEFAALIPIRISRWVLLTGLSVWNKAQRFSCPCILTSENAALLADWSVFPLSSFLVLALHTLIILRVDQSPNLINQSVWCYKYTHWSPHRHIHIHTD